MEMLKNIARTFVYILAGVTISTAIFISIFAPRVAFTVALLWQVIGTCSICAFGNLIYYSRKEISKKQMSIRIICHYLFINMVVFFASFLFGWVRSGIFPELFVMFILIAVVYSIIMLLTFQSDVKTAESMNRRLRRGED